MVDNIIKVIVIILGAVVMWTSSIGIIQIDNDYDIHITTSDKIILLVKYLLSVALILSRGVDNYILAIILVSALLSMALTDRKTKLIYTMIPLVIIIIEAVVLIYKGRITNLDKTSIIILGLFLALLLVLNITGGMGMGDTFIYIAIMLYFWIVTDFAMLMTVTTFLLSQVIMTITSLFKVIYGSNIRTIFKETQPLVPSIAKATLITIIFIG